MEPRRGPLTAGEKVQFTDRKGKKITDQLVAGGSTQTEHGLILHDDVIGKIEGTVILTVHAKREAQVNQVYPEKDKNKPWKSSRAIGGWEYAVMRRHGWSGDIPVDDEEAVRRIVSAARSSNWAGVRWLPSSKK